MEFQPRCIRGEMLINHFRSAWRHFAREKRTLLLPIAGLGLGLASCILIAVFAAAEHWLQSFAFRTALRPWIFAAVPLLAIGVALVIVGAKARAVSGTSLAGTLRVE